MAMKKLKVVIIGAGGRGRLYSKIMAAAPEKYELVAVADPIKERRDFIGDSYGIGEDMRFESWEMIFEMGKIADIAVISTMDKEHYEPTMAAIELGYDILLEKPVSPVPLECKRIAENAQKNGVKVVVCHVLRYTPLYSTIKQIIDDGIIGDIISVNHEECVWNQHFCHSFVRGNFSNTETSASMLLQKCCHDMDILQWLIGKKCLKVQSFGALKYFCEKNAPDGAPEFCLDGCPHEEKCMYSAKKIYLGNDEECWFRDRCTPNPNPTYEEKEEALHKNNHGRCAFKAGNNVCDHQTVNLLYEDDITVTFTVSGFNRSNRWTHIVGTKGELHANLRGYEPIEIYDLETRSKTQIPINRREDAIGSHGGGDDGIVEALYDYMATGVKSKQVSEIEISSQNHMIVFAAEKSRENGQVIDLKEYIESLG